MQQVRIVRISFCSNIFGIIFDRNLCRPKDLQFKKPEDLFYGMIECAEFATIVVTWALCVPAKAAFLCSVSEV